MKEIIVFSVLVLALCASLLVFSGCEGKKPSSVQPREAPELLCSCPHCRILIQPYGNVSQITVKDFCANFTEALGKHIGDLAVSEIIVLPNRQLKKDLMNDAKTRYRATKILDRQKQLKQRDDDVIIGLTEADISTTLRGKQDWGICGLSYLGASNSVVSTFRLKDKSQLWKLALHELGHACFGLPHCPNNDPACFMKDANGSPNFKKQRYFCDSCAKRLP